jgi:predicted dehydrogenase
MGSRNNAKNDAKERLKIAIVGLGFGAGWVPVYQGHPDVDCVAVCDIDRELLDNVAGRYGVERRYTQLEKVLDAEDLDAVHLLTPIPLHAEQTLAVLRAGKHCACAIPMALTTEDVDQIQKAQGKAAKVYMLMETEIYSRTYLFVKGLHRDGGFGELQLLRGFHYQNMEGWPDYWQGLPPMHYSSHGLGPILDLAGEKAVTVTAAGSGRLSQEMQGRYGNPFPVESAFFQLEGNLVVCEMTACFFKMARGFLVDRFSVYGDRLSFESPQVQGGDPLLFRSEEGPLQKGQRGRGVTVEKAVVPALADLVPAEISEYVRSSRNARCIPLAHEFIRSIIEERSPGIDVDFAANLTKAGLCAHQSAMRGGEPVSIPGSPL